MLLRNENQTFLADSICYTGNKTTFSHYEEKRKAIVYQVKWIVIWWSDGGGSSWKRTPVIHRHQNRNCTVCFGNLADAASGLVGSLFHTCPLVCLLYKLNRKRVEAIPSGKALTHSHTMPSLFDCLSSSLGSGLSYSWPADDDDGDDDAVDR